MADKTEMFADTLITTAAQKLAQDPANLAYRNERYVKWLVREAGLAQTMAQRSETVAAAEIFARRMSQKLTAERLSARIPAHELRQKPAPAILSVNDAASLARRYRCAPLIDMSVAAGQGRMLWDEPCDQWLELPDAIPLGRYVALQVTGDSMSPFLGARDVILIKLDASPAEDDVIVARLGDDGYVVKRVAAVHPDRLVLASVNPDYAQISIDRDVSHVVGTVIALFRTLHKQS